MQNTLLATADGRNAQGGGTPDWEYWKYYEYKEGAWLRESHGL